MIALLKAFGGSIASGVKSLLWDAETGTVSSKRTNMLLTTLLATYIIHWMLSRADAHFAIHKSFPDNIFEIMAGIVSILVGGGVGGYLFSRRSTKSSSDLILPDSYEHASYGSDEEPMMSKGLVEQTDHSLSEVGSEEGNDNTAG